MNFNVSRLARRFWPPAIAALFTLLLSWGSLAASAQERSAGDTSSRGAGQKATTVLVSRADGDGHGGDGPSYEPSVSADGRYVAFTSHSLNLASGLGGTQGNGRRFEVYVRDLVARKTTLVSRADGMTGAPASVANEPSISADGKRVAFVAEASDWGLGAEKNQDQVYVRDLASGTTTLVSRADGRDGAVADDGAFEPDISADGDHVAFASSAKNLRPEGTEEGTDVYVRDLASGRTEAITPDDPDRGGSGEPSISGNGLRVAFASTARLVPEDRDPAGDSEAEPDVYVRDRQLAETVLVSRASGPNGRPSVRGAEAPSISDDGLHVVFETDDEFFPRRWGHYVRDLLTDKTVWVGLGRPSGGAGGPAVLSADGRYVAFSSESNHLSPIDSGYADVLVRDLKTGLVIDAARASGPSGLPADGPSFLPAISADGSAVAFGSNAANLSDADEDAFGDVFLRRPRYVKESPLPTCEGETATRIGTPAADRLEGSLRRDVIIALGGNDRIRTRNGSDLVCAGAGDDFVDAGPLDAEGVYNGEIEIVRGEAGADRLHGGTEGPSLLRGGEGNDFLYGTRAHDRLFGGRGKDHLFGGGRLVRDLLSGGPGRDVLHP